MGVVLPCATTAAAASPAWRIDALPNTTAAPGGTLDYLVQVTNGGSADSDGGPLALVATLPDGVRAVAPSAAGAVTSSFQVSGGGLASASTVDPTTITAILPPFGVDAFDSQVTDFVGAPFTQAGGHPSAASTALDLTTITNPNPPAGPLWPVEPAKDLPPGQKTAETVRKAQRDTARRPGREDGEDEKGAAGLSSVRRRARAVRARRPRLRLRGGGRMR